MTIKTKIAITVLFIFLSAIFIGCTYIRSHLTANWQQDIEFRHLSMLEKIAIMKNSEMDKGIRFLENISEKFDSSRYGDIDYVRGYFSDRINCKLFFESGVVLIDKNGTCIFDSSHEYNRVGQDYSDRDFFKQSIKSNTSIVSQPFIGKVTKKPIIAISAPVFDENNQTIALIMGVQELNAKNFLTELSNEKFGRSGTFYVVSIKDGLFLDKYLDKVSLKNLSNSHEGKMFENVLNKDRVSIITKNQNGEEVLLSSIKFGNGNDWLLAVSIPTKEIFEPIEKTTSQMLLTVFISSILIVILVWIVVNILLNPLKNISNKFREMAKTQHLEPIHTGCSKEIQEFVDSFNILQNRILELENELIAKNTQLKCFSESLADLVELEVASRMNIQRETERERELYNKYRFESIVEMFQNIAHHWRQPLNAIGLTSEMVYEKLDSINEECAKAVEFELENISNNVQYLSKTINMFSKYFISSDKDDNIELKSEIEQIVLILKPNLELHNSEVITNLENVTIFGKKSFFANIIFMVITNSIESISKKQEKDINFKGLIDISLNIVHDNIVIKIADNGIGVDTKIIDTIFEPYVSTKFKAKDVGLSLFLAKLSVINDFNGKIYINKNKSDGAEFIIELPVLKS